MAETEPTNGSGGSTLAAATPATAVSGLQVLAELRAANALLERKAFADEHGLTFWSEAEGAYQRDLFAVAGYLSSKQLTTAVYRSRYSRGGIAERIIEAYPKATWAGGADIVEDPDPGTETPFEEAVWALFNRLGAYDRIERADILAGLGHYGVLLIGAKRSGGAKSTLDKELPRLNGPDAILTLTPLADDHAKVKSEVLDPEDERFGLPLLYEVDLGAGLTGQKITDRRRVVHWSRIIHVAEGLLENDLLGKPRLRACWNRLDDLEKILAGGSEATWKRADPGIHANVPLFSPDGKVLEFKDADLAAMKEEVELYRHNLSRFIKTRGVELEQLESSVPAFGGNAEAVMSQISAITEIPVRLLTGSERGELASTQDASNWADRVDRRRQRFGTAVLRQLVDRLIKYGALPEPAEYEVAWPEIDELNEEEKATVAGLIATANLNQVHAGEPPIMATNEIRDRIFKIGPIEEIEGFEDSETGEPVEPPEDRLQAAKLRVAVRRGLIRRRQPVASPSPERPPLRLVANAAEEPEYRSIHRAADANAPRVAALFLALWASMSSRIGASDLEAAIATGSAPAAEQAAIVAIVEAEREYRDRIQAAISRTLEDGALAALRSARSRGSWFRSARAWDDVQLLGAAGFSFDFDATNPRALEWAALRSSTLINIEVGPDIRAAVRELIANGFSQGIPPAKLAQDIRAIVGLRPDQLRAVGNLEAALRDPANFGRTVTRFPPAPTLREVPGFRVRVPKSGLSEEALAERLDKYREMQRNLRARTIARRETAFASNRGQVELWLQAKEAGQIPDDQKRVWIHSGDDAVRDSHRAMGGQIRGIEEKFQRPDGVEIEAGEEVGCRCVTGLATPEDLERAA